MEKSTIIIFLAFTIIGCTNSNEATQKPEKGIVGTWKLVYGEVKENDSLTVRDVSKSDFIKIINETHFSFLSQTYQKPITFYGAGGTYTLKGSIYTEKLTHCDWDDYRGKNFPFTVKITKDSLIQYGVEEIKEKNIKRYVVEKYIKIK